MPDRSPYTAVVEISRDSDGTVETELISAAYRASIRAPVMLVLHSVSRAEVDRVLDELVAARWRDVAGVLYVDVDDVRVVSGAVSAHFVLARSERLRAKLESHGIPYSSVIDARQRLNAAFS